MTKICSINKEMQDKGFIITTKDLMPKVIKTPKGLCGLDSLHLLYVFAHSVIYKFKCDDLSTDKFSKTKEYIKTYYQHSIIKSKPIFSSKNKKTLDSNPDLFFIEFKEVLNQDLKSYFGKSSKELVKKSILELEKIV